MQHNSTADPQPFFTMLIHQLNAYPFETPPNHNKLINLQEKERLMMKVSAIKSKLLCMQEEKFHELTKQFDAKVDSFATGLAFCLQKAVKEHTANLEMNEYKDFLS